MTAAPLRVIFMGTPDFVVPTLQALIAAHEVVGVYTQPPRIQGRGQSQAQPSPIHTAANAVGIPVFTPENFKKEADVAAFRALNADIAVVAAYGMLLPQEILDAPKYGCINIHPSLLPRWRGSAPIQFAIWKGDEVTGVSVMKLVKKMDAGPVIAQSKVAIADHDFTTLNKKLWEIGTQLVLQALDTLKNTGVAEETEQASDGITFTHMLEKHHGRIDWSQSALDIEHQVRGLNPWPGTWCESQEGKRIKILSARALDNKAPGISGTLMNAMGDVACGSGVLRLITIQPEGKKPMDVSAAFNGGALKTGDKLQ